MSDKKNSCDAKRQKIEVYRKTPPKLRQNSEALQNPCLLASVCHPDILMRQRNHQQSQTTYALLHHHTDGYQVRHVA